ncbi:UNVERIFIED_CONTAM: hypothetical protein RMT77_019621 [Armadillidium vulgare]
MNDKEVKGKEIYDESQQEMAPFSSSLSFTQNETEERIQRSLSSNALKSCIPNITDDNMV